MNIEIIAAMVIVDRRDASPCHCFLEQACCAAIAQTISSARAVRAGSESYPLICEYSQRRALPEWLTTLERECDRLSSALDGVFITGEITVEGIRPRTVSPSPRQVTGSRV
jgi:hypothetical protein